MGGGKEVNAKVIVTRKCNACNKVVAYLIGQRLDAVGQGTPSIAMPRYTKFGEQQT